MGLAALAWILARLDYGHLGALLADADLRYLALVPLAVIAEQLVRAWKWRQFLKEGLEVYRADGRFRLFVYARGSRAPRPWPCPSMSSRRRLRALASPRSQCCSAHRQSAPSSQIRSGAGGGDRIGKRPLLEGVAVLSILAPGLALAWPAADGTMTWFGAVFFALGAVGNGGTIAQLGYLMEISPDDRRPAYSGYFNAIVAPAALSPLAGAAFVESIGLALVFAASAVAAILQFLTVRRLRRLESKEAGAWSRA